MSMLTDEQLADIEARMRAIDSEPRGVDDAWMVQDLLGIGTSLLAEVKRLRADRDYALVLTDRERDIMERRARGESLAVIGAAYGICRERVRQLHEQGRRTRQLLERRVRLHRVEGAPT